VVVLIKFDIGTYARLESKKVLEFGVDCVRDSSGISLYLNETIVVVLWREYSDSPTIIVSVLAEIIMETPKIEQNTLICKCKSG
jgi:hypothetical protein